MFRYWYMVLSQAIELPWKRLANLRQEVKAVDLKPLVIGKKPKQTVLGRKLDAAAFQFDKGRFLL